MVDAIVHRSNARFAKCDDHADCTDESGGLYVTYALQQNLQCKMDAATRLRRAKMSAMFQM
jgi:hypothetical protein